MSKLTDFVADILLPNRCPCCDSFIMWNELVCEKCRGELLPFSGDRLLPSGCSATAAVFAFDGPAKKGIYALKDGYGKNFVKYSVPLLAEKLRGCGADLITSVPMSKQKKAERGFNQAELIAHELARLLGVHEDHTLLSRLPTSLEQHELTAADRMEFSGEIYDIAPGHRSVGGRSIILVDDVHTTGATLGTCAGLLLAMGAKEVIGAALCRTVLQA